MAVGGGQGLPALLLLLLLRLCEASAGRPAGPAGGGSRRPGRPRDLALGAALSPQVSGREPACPRPCGGRCPAEPPRCAPGVPAVLDGCSCCLVCARQRGESCSPLLPCDESSGLYCDRGPEDGGGAAGICMGRWRRAGDPGAPGGRHGGPRLRQPSPGRWGVPPRAGARRGLRRGLPLSRSSPAFPRAQRLFPARAVGLGREGCGARPAAGAGGRAARGARGGCERPRLRERRPLFSVVLEGDNCVFDGMIYRNGETFQPSCKYQCTCRDGQIGCLPRCNLDLLLPGPDCPFPRKIEVPGECCEKWICDPKDEVILGGFAMAGEETKTVTVIVRRR